MVYWGQHQGVKGMDISRDIAQEIIDEVGGVLGQQLNFFDARGYILASATPERVGSLHEGAAKLIKEGLEELIVYADDEYLGARKGCNLPLMMDKELVGAIGITGEYEQVRKYGQIIKKMTEILLRDHDEQQRKKIEGRIRTRFLDDWIMTEQNLADPGFLQRAQAQDIDVSLPRRVVAMRIVDILRYSDSPTGQETIDTINRRVRQTLGRIPGAIFSKTPSVMLCLLPAQEDEALVQFVQRVFEDILAKYGIPLMAGVDSAGGGEPPSIHHAYQQAMKALQACPAQEGRRILFYDDITYELFLEEVSPGAKKLFVSRVFRGMGEREADEYAALLGTLYEMDGSITKTANAHFIHKNSLQYKLNKLARLTGHDPRSYGSIPLYTLAMLFRKE